MKKKGFKIIVLSVLWICPFLLSSDNYRVVNGPAEFYYGHISLVDIKNDGKDPLVFREGAAGPEIAVLNFPLGPGDTIRTSDERRCEIQFDNATIVRLDVNTELKIETILAQSLSSRNKVSNLVLRAGRIYAMYKEYASSEMFQVLTPNVAVKFRHNSVAAIAAKDDGSTDVQVEFGKATVLFGPDPAKPADKAVYKNEQLTVLADQTFAFGEFTSATDFDLWNKEINKNFLELHKGLTAIPKPVQKLPKAVFYFAQTFGNHYGEWLYDDFYGYVWRPFYNDTYPWGTWQPYFYGRWSTYAGQMYWVPEEPWGWVPYHLGVWQWDDKRGWLWLPGSAFAPAWVDWAFFGGSFCSWRPWSLWDWMWYNDMSMFGYGMYDFYFPYYDWTFMGRWGYDPYLPTGSGPFKPALGKVRIDQLKSPGDPPLPITKEMDKIYKTLREALIHGDQRALVSLRSLTRHSVFVGAQDLSASKIQTKASRLEPFLNAVQSLPSGSPLKTILNLRPQSPHSSSFLAVKNYELHAPVGEIRNSVSPDASRRVSAGSAVRPSRPVPSGLRTAVPALPARTHDWNPDTRIGRKLGVDILYASRTNEIYSPQLRISSAMAGARPILDSNGIIRRVVRSNGGSDPAYSGSSPGSSSASGGGSSSGSAGTMSTGSSSGSSSSGSSSSGAGSSGHIRH